MVRFKYRMFNFTYQEGTYEKAFVDIGIICIFDDILRESAVLGG